MPNSNQLTIYSIKSFTKRVDISTCIGLYGLKDRYTKKCIQSINKK